ncbi:MAG: hypothetical protein PHE84_06245 [bacterium]|nr:hypothetical protein [bacterium]
MKVKPDKFPGHSPAQVGIYMGEGTAHSWTWWAEYFEKIGFYRQQYLDEENFASRLGGVDFLCLSGGDTFAIAAGLGPAGARALGEFFSGEKVYLGSCAGAYLPLRSSQESLRRFNFLSIPVANIVSDPPLGLEFSPRTMIPYGNRYLIHPVRDEVVLRPLGSCPQATVTAPLFGGPPFAPGADTPGLIPRATYENFTPRTSFPAGPELARRIFQGREAVLEARLGPSTLFLLGPHLEHPRFPAANQFLTYLLEPYFARGPKTAPAEPGPEETSPELLREIKKELSRSRFTVQSLTQLSLSFEIGRKLYEPEKIAELLEFAWKRIRKFRPGAGLPVAAGETLRTQAARLRENLEDFGAAVRGGGEAAGMMLQSLRSAKRFLAGFLPLYHRWGCPGEEIN